MDLLTAVKVESLEKIKELIKKQGVPHDAKWLDYKVLNVALEYGRKDVALLLLDQNCRVNKTSKSTKDSTPLHNAVKLGSVEIVKKLLEKQASAVAVDTEKNTSLHLAFISKNDTLVDLLLDNLQQTSNHVNFKNNQGLSHFHIACTAKDGQIIQGFIDAGANLDDAVYEKSPYWAGFTAMHFAVSYKCLEAVSTLLKLDAKHDTKTTDGKTPLDIVDQSVKDLLIIIDLLKKKSDSRPYNRLTNFLIACLQENEQVVENYIKYGSDIDSETPSDLHLSSSSWPIHCAVESKSKSKVELLLKQLNGKVDTYTNSEEMTPMHLALYNEKFCEHNEKKNKTEILDLLYSAIEDKMDNKVDIYGMSYFHVAVMRNDLVTVKNYLDKDKGIANEVISINPYGFSNYRPLHFAVEYYCQDIIELLLDYGADINAICEDGTALHLAVWNGDIDLIDLLLEKGAKVELLEPNSRDTLLHKLLGRVYTEEELRQGNHLSKNKETILLYTEHFIKLGVNVNAKDSMGFTSLHCTDIEGSGNIHQLLFDLGADINIENDDGDLPFHLPSEESDIFDYRSLIIFYHHVQKLKALGMKIHPKNEEICKKIAEKGKFEKGELALMEQKRLDEIIKLKSIKLGDATTLFDFLKLDSRRAGLFAQSKVLKKIAMDSELKEKYPLYAYLIKLQYNMALKSFKEKKQTGNGYEKQEMP